MCMWLKINKRGESVDDKIKKLDEELGRYKEQIRKTRPGPSQDAIKARAIRLLKHKRMYSTLLLLTILLLVEYLLLLHYATLMNVRCLFQGTKNSATCSTTRPIISTKSLSLPMASKTLSRPYVLLHIYSPPCLFLLSPCLWIIAEPFFCLLIYRFLRWMPWRPPIKSSREWWRQSRLRTSMYASLSL